MKVYVMRAVAFGWITIACCLASARADEQLPVIEKQDFLRLQEMIRPYPGESPWRQIDWLTNITEARRRAIEEDKPIVIFTAADGSPLGRT